MTHEFLCSELFGTIKKRLAENQFTWLITGVAGFIGSNLMEALLSLNQKVIGVDNFYSGYQANIEEVLQDLPAHYRDNFSFYKGDICSEYDCLQVMQDVDYVLHHAAVCSVPYSIENPVLIDKVNVGGFVNILLTAHKCKVKRVIYASSSAIYGDSPVSPKVEDQNANPISPYAASKYISEVYAQTFAKCYGLETIGLRYFNVFGARQDPKGAYAAVIPTWIIAMLKKEPVFVNGDGETTRDFCYIENVVQANLLSALIENFEAINTIYNVGCGKQTTLNQTFLTIRSLLNIDNSYQPSYRSFRSGDIRHSVSNISKITKMLGYRPLYQLKDGLLLALNWYQKNRK